MFTHLMTILKSATLGDFASPLLPGLACHCSAQLRYKCVLVETLPAPAFSCAAPSGSPQVTGWSIEPREELEELSVLYWLILQINFVKLHVTRLFKTTMTMTQYPVPKISLLQIV